MSSRSDTDSYKGAFFGVASVLLGLLVAEPRPLRVADVRTHPSSFGFPAEHPPMGSFLGVPILIRGQAWGNLYLTDKPGGEFDDADEQAAVTLAAWTAIAIEHARLLSAAGSKLQTWSVTSIRFFAT